MTGSELTGRRIGILFGALLLLAALMLAIYAPHHASAQTPSICGEYPNTPGCDDGGGGGGGGPGGGGGNGPGGGGGGPGGGGGNGPGGGGGGPGGGSGGGPGSSVGTGSSTATASAGDASGTLPFTGYPITDLLLLMAAFLGFGLALRTYLAIRERLERNSTG